MKPWPIITEDDEVQIVLPEFHDTYFGDVDTMTPEEWRIVHLISATPMLLEACKAHQAVGDHVERCPRCGVGATCTTYNGLAKKANELTKSAFAKVEETT